MHYVLSQPQIQLSEKIIVYELTSENADSMQYKVKVHTCIDLIL